MDIKKMVFSVVVMLCTVAVLSGCGPRGIRTYSDADTDECRTMTEICKDAREFQREYENLPEEEKKDMASVLNTYSEHCTQAMKACENSKKD